MRAKRRGHPLSRARVAPPPGSELTALAERATYHPSAEHKDRYVPGTGVLDGHVGGPWSDQPFPQYAWHRLGDTVFEARLTNAEQGWFKGYPLRPGEEPTWLP